MHLVGCRLKLDQYFLHRRGQFEINLEKMSNMDDLFAPAPESDQESENSEQETETATDENSEQPEPEEEPVAQWDTFGLDQRILAGIAAAGWKEPTEIQEAALPIGKFDKSMDIFL